MIRKITQSLIFILMVIGVTLSLCFPCGAEGEESEDKITLYPEITSNNALVVYSIESNQVLYSNRGDEVLGPTVAAKLVSMMVVYDIFSEHGIIAETQMVTVTAEAISRTTIGELGDKSVPRLGLAVGEVYTAAELINASIIANESDACSVLAYYCATELLGGEIGLFTQRMNQKAAEIGAKNSTFKNATGFDQTGMVTTPKDVALIAAAFYKYNTLLEISKKGSMTLNGSATIHTKNYLLSDFLIEGYTNEYAIGMIAGQRTDTSDYALITAVESEGLSYIIVVMGASGEIRNTDGSRSFTTGNAYDDMNILIKWTRKSFGYKALADTGDIIAEIKVDLGKNYDYVSIVPEKKFEQLVNKSVDLNKVEKTIHYDTAVVYKGDYSDTVVDMMSAPITKGQKVGTLVFSYEGIELGSVNLIAQSSVDSSGLLTTANKIQNFLFGKTMRVIIIVFAVIIVLYVIFAIVTSSLRGVKRIKKAAGNRRLNNKNDSDEDKNTRE